MLRALAFALPLLVSASVEAAGFMVEQPAGIDLARGEEAPLLSSDIQLEKGLLRAPRGVRVEGESTPSATVIPLSAGRSYLCAAKDGATYRLNVLALTRTQAIVAVEDPGAELDPDLPTVGRFRLAALTMNGVRAASTMPELVLTADSRYGLGLAEGFWSRHGRMLQLDGHYGAWGPAEIDRGGRVLVFRFKRGGVQFEAVFERATLHEDAIARSR